MVNDSSSLDLNSSITLSAWVYPRNASQGYVLCKFGAYMLQWNGASALQGGIWINDTWTALVTSGTIPLNAWTHVTFTYNQSKAYLYINGTSVGSGTKNSSVDVNTNPFVIGAKSTSDRTRDFNGSIDEVGVWNRALTTSEVKLLYDYGRNYDEYASTDFHFRMYNQETYLYGVPDTLISNVYDGQGLNRYMFERANPYKYTDPTGHLILGTQTAGEAAFGPGGGYANGNLLEIKLDGTYNRYKFETITFGGGLGGSLSYELMLGIFTTAKDFSGKGYTGQFGVTDPAGVGYGPSWSGNVPMGDGGQPKILKSYTAIGGGGQAGVGGIQIYGGETTTTIKLVKTGKWNPFSAKETSLQTNQASCSSSQDSSSQSTGASTSSSANTGSISLVSKVYKGFIKTFKSIFR